MLACKAHRLLYHPTLGSRAIKKKQKVHLAGSDLALRSLGGGRSPNCKRAALFPATNLSINQSINQSTEKLTDLVFKAHRLLYHSALDLRVIKISVNSVVIS